MELSGVVILPKEDVEMKTVLEDEEPERLQARMRQAFHEICYSG